jgi:ribosomal protein L11 methyltransferase (prmA)
MKLGDFLNEAKTKIDSLDAELILVNALDFSDRTELVLNSKREYNYNLAEKMIEKRKSGVPLAYILHRKEFYGRDFYVDQNVLIPRVETEQMIMTVLELIDSVRMKSETEEGVKNTGETGAISIIDVGTGSGCIPITLKLELNQRRIQSKIFGTDISKLALEVAKQNAEKMLAGVTFYESDLLSQVERLPDIITANLPYVDVKWDFLSPSLKYEPALALYAGDGGLKLIKKLIDQIEEKRLNEIKKMDASEGVNEKRKQKRFLVLEADVLQSEAIIKYANEHGFKLITYEKYILGFSY